MYLQIDLRSSVEHLSGFPYSNRHNQDYMIDTLDIPLTDYYYRIFTTVVWSLAHLAEDGFGKGIV